MGLVNVMMHNMYTESHDLSAHGQSRKSDSLALITGQMVDSRHILANVDMFRDFLSTSSMKHWNIIIFQECIINFMVERINVVLAGLCELLAAVSL